MTRKYNLILAVYVTLICIAVLFAACDTGASEKLTATYDDSHTAYAEDEIDSLRPYLTVKYTNKKGTETTVQNYTLSGILQEGDSVLKVEYNGSTCYVTISVPVTVSLLRYVSEDKESYTVVGINEKTTVDLVVPSEYHGKPVTTIGRSAFDYCSNLTSITIPKSVTTIGNDAFASCSNLTQVNYTGKIADWCNISFGNNFANPLNYGVDLYINNELVTELIIPDSVTEIKNYAFQGCTSITSVTIPDSVQSIGLYAFYQCNNLTTVTIPDSVTAIDKDAFNGCRNIEQATIPASAIAYIPKTNLKTVVITSGTAIEPEAFRNHYGLLTSVTIGISVTTIGSSAFSSCSNLTKVNYMGTIADWCNISFGNSSANPLNYGADLYINNELVTELIIPDTVTEIKNAFSGCTSITSVTIPDSVQTIGAYAFDNCSNLTSVTIGNSVTTIGHEAFPDCSNLTQVNYTGTIADWCNISFANEYANPLNHGADLYLNNELVTELIIPDTVTEIKHYAFQGCTSITSVTIHDSVQSIGVEAFTKCSNLQYNEYNNALYLGNADNPYLVLVRAKNYDITTCTINSNTRFIHPYAFGGCSLTSITIPDSVTTIGYGAFAECSNLTSIIIPDSVITIGPFVFTRCSNLTTVTIPDSVTTIGYGAFAECSNLTSVTIPDSVKTIDAYAFYECSNLTSVTIPDSVQSIGIHAFSGCSLISITIPNSVQSIGIRAFYECSNLTTINFKGTVSQWKDITKDTGWNDNVPATEVICSDGEVTL